MATQQIIENAMPSQPSTNSFNAEQTLTNQKPMTLKFLQTTKKTKVPFSYTKRLNVTKISNQIKEKSLDWNIKFLDNTNVVTLASGHIDAETYYDSLHLINEKGTKKLANDIKFALGLQTKMQSTNRDYYSRQEKPTANSKSRPALSSVVTITPPRVSKVQPVEPSISQSQRQETTQNIAPAPADIPTAQDLNPKINRLTENLSGLYIVLCRINK